MRTTVAQPFRGAMPRSVENIRPRKEQLADSHAGSMWPPEHSTGGDIVELPTVYMFIGRIARISLTSHFHPPDDREVVSDEFLESHAVWQRAARFGGRRMNCASE